MKKTLILLTLLCTSFPAWAMKDSPRNTFEQLQNCGDFGCRDQITTTSYGLYDRMEKQKIRHCLPSNLTYISEDGVGEYTVVRGSADIMERDHIFRLWMTQENGKWKLDIPTSMRAGLGNDWNKKVTATEQLYTLMQQQLGGSLGCDMLYQLIGGNK